MCPRKLNIFFTTSQQLTSVIISSFQNIFKHRTQLEIAKEWKCKKVPLALVFYFIESAIPLPFWYCVSGIAE